jgi:cytochrome b pre-mRNA-processing protein 3
MMLRSIFQRKPKAHQALYESIVAAARRPHFYADWNVPDTVDGRFDMITLHMFAVLDRLKDELSPEAADFSQQLVDTFFLDMDRSLREMGVGDLSVGKKVRKIAESFYGRVDAYRAALASDATSDLDAAITRNVFADTDNANPSALAQWLKLTRAHLKAQPLSAFLSAQIDFA